MLECTCKCASIIFIIIWSAVVLLVTSLVAVSFSTLELNTAGIKFDTINYILEANSIYLAGRHWIGLGNEFKVFPLDYQTINFSTSEFGNIITKTSDPLQVYLEVSVTYKLRAEFLIQLCNRFPNMDYHYVFSNIAKAIIMTTAQNYTLNDFFIKRGEISDQMSNNINLEFRGMFAELELFQLKEIILDESIEIGIVNNLVTQNDAEIHKESSQIKITEGLIENIKYISMNNVNTIMSNAYSNNNITLSQSDANNLNNVIASHSTLFRNFVSPNGLNFSQKELNKLMYLMHWDETTFYDKEDIDKSDLTSMPKSQFKNTYGINNFYLFNK